MMSKLVLAMMMLGAEAAPVAKATPSGVYFGSKSTLGTTVNITVNLMPATDNAAIKIRGPLTVNCNHEAYTYDGKSDIDVTNKDKAGDCIHDTLAKAPGGGTLSSVVYDTASDQMTVTCKVAFLSIPVVLTKEGVAAVQPADDHESWFNEFVQHFSKSYSAAEQPERLNTFKANLAKVESLNVAGPLDRDAWPNVHSDLTAEEFAARQFA